MNETSLKELPAVHEVLTMLGSQPVPHAVVVNEVRRVLEQARESVRQGGSVPDVAELARTAIDSLTRLSLRRVINATGVILHTNLGRAPLPALPSVTGYSNLEFDVETGRRGRRDTHTAGLLQRILGAPALVVNNNAAAIYLALNELASGGEAIVSRGELIEIGDGFRIPDVMRCAGAQLREVGTTNRTRIEDYADAISDRTRLLLIVHPSNFRIEGFSGKPAREEIVALGRERNIPVYEDLGSGCLADLSPHGIDEPRPQEAIEAGVSLVSFSGDKLLGGPQCGILAGDAALLARLRRNPMFRALRVDKLITSSLETTLRHVLLEQWESIPALRMIMTTTDLIRLRAEDLVEGLPGAQLVAGESLVGGGSTPGQSLPTWLITIQCDAERAEARLRHHRVPVIARIEEGCLVIDLRTVAEEDEPELRAALRAALYSKE
jgi:L-seryl-tRNA(Ser) seleniumtransferase